MNHLKVKFLFYIFCLLLFSCGNDCRKIIHGGDYKYWRFTEKDWNVPLYYYFDDKGKWTLFIAYKTGFREYDGDDDLLYKKWELKSDSVLYFNGLPWIIKSICKDSIVLFSPNKMRTIYSVPDTTIPKEFRKKM